MLGEGQTPLESLFSLNPKEMARSLASWDHSNLPVAMKIPRPDFFGATLSLCSACHRGYIGEWVINNNKLQLKDIRDIEGSRSLLALVFPDHHGLIESSWFTGNLHLSSIFTQTRVRIELRSRGLVDSILQITREEEEFIIHVRSGDVIEMSKINSF